MANRVTLLALDECFASSIACTVDLLNTANLVAAALDPPREPVFEWQVLSLDGRAVRASNGYDIPVDGRIDGSLRGKLVVVPAFGSPHPDLLVGALQRQQALLPWLRSEHASGVTIAASCSGTFLLAESGLLDGRRATTSWWLAAAFERRYPAVRLELASMLTEDGRLICAGAGMSHLDLALRLIERFGGRDIGRLCAKYAVLDDGRRSQAPFVVLTHVRSYDPLIVRAERWIRANLHRSIGVDEIAGQVAVSPRTLARRFRECTGDSPQVFVQKARIEMSKALLENTELSADAIVERVGYGDARTFRRLFRKHTSLSPRDYRKRFAAQPARQPPDGDRT